MAYTLQYWKNQKRIVEQKIRNAQRNNENIRAQITELEKAYNKVGALKRTNRVCAESIRRNVKLDKIGSGLKWRGKSKKNFDKRVNDGVVRSANSFYTSLDRVQDEIGRALDSKRKEVSTGIGIIDALNRSLISITGTIRNWVN